MDRLALTLAIIAFFGLCLCGMWLGWRHKAHSQSTEIPPFPAAPDSLGELTLPEATGLYVSTTTAGHWQDRIVARGMGSRSKVTLRLHASGLQLDRVGAPGFWIPAEALAGVRRDKRIAGKVMGVDNLLVITWKTGGVLLDTGIRGDDVEVYPQWIEAISAVVRQDRAGKVGESKGGSQ